MSFGHPIADFEHPNIHIFCVLCIGMKMNWTPNSPQMFVCLFFFFLLFFFWGGGGTAVPAELSKMFIDIDSSGSTLHSSLYGVVTVRIVNVNMHWNSFRKSIN